MSLDDAPAPRTAAVVPRGRWPGLVWAVPLAALLLAGWLALRALTHPGVTVTLDVESAEGIKTGDTHVTYLGMDVGAVEAIGLSPRPRLIRLSLKINPSIAPLLRTGTRFWVTGANPNLTNLSSLRATISGPSVGMAPGPGAPNRVFTAADRAPVMLPAGPGSHYRLMAPDVTSVDEGTPIYTHGWQVGTILGVRDAGAMGFEIDAFVRAPFDRLVRRSSRFWDASPLQITDTAGGLEARLTSAKIALAGGVSFETPPEVADQSRAPAGTAFPLLADAGQAATDPLGPEVDYQVAFTGPVGELKTGAPVKLRGFEVGRVVSVHFDFDQAAGVIHAPVVIGLDPVRLHVAPTRAAVDAILAGLVAHGMRARLTQSPPLIGGRSVDLIIAGGSGPGRIQPGSPYPWLPSTASGDLGDVAVQADTLLTKANAVPIEEIGRNLRALTANLDSLTGSPKVRDSLDHLDSTLATLDRTVQQTGPKIGPLVDALHRTADQAQAAAAAAGQMMGANGGAQEGDLPSAVRQLDEAARSIRSLADYLSRHPESVIRGKKEQR